MTDLTAEVAAALVRIQDVPRQRQAEVIVQVVVERCALVAETSPPCEWGCDGEIAERIRALLPEVTP